MTISIRLDLSIMEYEIGSLFSFNYYLILYLYIYKNDALGRLILELQLYYKFNVQVKKKAKLSCTLKE